MVRGRLCQWARVEEQPPLRTAIGVIANQPLGTGAGVIFVRETSPVGYQQITVYDQTGQPVRTLSR